MMPLPMLPGIEPVHLLLAIVVVLLLALPIGAIRLSGREAPDLSSVPASLQPPLQEADHYSRWARSTAILAAFTTTAIAYLAALSVAPGVFGIVGVSALLIADRRRPVVTTTARTAGLTPRRARDYAPWQALLIPAGLAVALVLVLTPFPDGTGSSTNGRLTTLLMLILQLALAVWGLHQAAQREQLSTAYDNGLDGLLRRRLSEGIVGFLLIALALALLTLNHPGFEAVCRGAVPWSRPEAAVSALGALVSAMCLVAGTSLLIRRSSVVVGLAEPTEAAGSASAGSIPEGVWGRA